MVLSSRKLCNFLICQIAHRVKQVHRDLSRIGNLLIFALSRHILCGYVVIAADGLYDEVRRDDLFFRLYYV